MVWKGEHGEVYTTNGDKLSFFDGIYGFFGYFSAEFTG